MKKQLLIASFLFAAGTGVFAQTSGRNLSPVTLSGTARPVANHDRNVTCTADTLRYAILKEYAFSPTAPAFYTAPLNGPSEEQSQAFLSPGTVSVVGVNFRGRANSANPTAIIPVMVYLYSVDASFTPVARLDSALVTVSGTTVGNYNANFITPHVTTGNYAVSVRPTTAFKLDFLLNNRDAGTGGEALSFNKWDATSSGVVTWDANAPAWGQDFDTDVNPIVTYSIATDYTISNASPVCIGTALTFTNTTTPATLLSSRMYNYNAFVAYFGATTDSTFAWDMGDASSLIWSANATYTYPAAGTYTTTLHTLAGFWNSCTDSKATTTVVAPVPVLTITNPAAACAPSTVDITAPAVTAGSTGSGALTYWINSAATSPLTTASAVGTTGIYYIQSSTAPGCNDLQPVTVTINAVDDATITQPGMICSNAAPFNLTAATAGGTWSGTGITNGSAGTFDPATATVGSNTITYTTAGACPAADAITVTVSVCTGIQNYADASAVNVYPNPSSTGVFTVDLGTTVKSTLEVYNVVGASVFAKQFNTQLISLELNDFNTGVYFLKVTTDKGQITKKITITK